MKFQVQATEQQFAQFERMCTINEGLLATTLMKRFKIESTDENFALVSGWLRSARTMGIASQLMCGICPKVVEDNQTDTVKE
jgi:hypothetical protein